MAGGEGGGNTSRELDQTPTYAVATVVAVIIIVSILLEKGLHHLGEWFTKKHKKALYDALDKVKAELMVLGFISLLLTFGQNQIAKICIPEKAANVMLPCRRNDTSKTSGKRLLWGTDFENSSLERRILAADTAGPSCRTGKVSFVSTNGIHQLHIFIFFLAVFHVLFSAITMALGRAKMRRWKEWEKETSSLDYEFSNDPTRFRLSHETSFVRAHSSFWNRIPILFYIVCFFRQFFRSVRKADYLTMRHGFIAVHLAPGTKFDFHKYIKRSLEDDFKVVVAISPVLWASAVVFLLLDVYKWNALFYISILPLVIILLVGTKLQAIITKLALEIQERHTVVQGIPIVQLSDKHFWFGSPKLVLSLIHFTLFQNAFEITYFFWIWYEFKLRSCFHEKFALIIARVFLGVVGQFMCCYITLPLYALVTQMGSYMKKAVFDEQTSKALKKWHMAAKKRQGKSGHSRAPSPSASPSVSPVASPAHPLHRFRTTGHATRPTRLRSNHSDQDMSDMEADLEPLSPSPISVSHVDHHHQELELTEHVDDTHKEDDFSFVRP